MKKFLLLFLVALCLSVNEKAHAQMPVYQNLIFVTTAPSGACTGGSPVQVVISTGALYSCQSGTWGQVGGGGAPSGPAGGALSGTYPNPGLASQSNFLATTFTTTSQTLVSTGLSCTVAANTSKRLEFYIYPIITTFTNPSISFGIGANVAPTFMYAFEGITTSPLGNGPIIPGASGVITTTGAVLIADGGSYTWADSAPRPGFVQVTIQTGASPTTVTLYEEDSSPPGDTVGLYAGSSCGPLL